MAQDLLNAFARPRSSPPQCCGRPRATRRWWWSIWSIWAAATRANAPRISCWRLGARLKLVGLATKAGYACPLSQYLLADALGLSAVHINRVLRELREDGLLTFQKGRVTFDDFDGLVASVDFDMTYLDHDGPLLR